MSETLPQTTTAPPQANRLLTMDTPLDPDEVLLTSLEGEDVLSRCFLYRITIVTEQPDNAVQSLLGMPVTLWMRNDSHEQGRPVHGHVRRLVGQGTTPRGAGLYRLEVVPRLWFLSCTSDCRIFQNQSIPDIIQTIFSDEGLTDFEFRIVRADYPLVEYCVQYQETALNFVSRLMEHLGLFYWHEHSANRHLLVIADRNAATVQCQPAQVSLSPVTGEGDLQSLDIDCSFRPGRWTLNDYDFQSPTKLLRVDAPTTRTVPRMADHEMYEYPGKFLDQDIGRWLSRRRIEFEEAQQRRVFGTGRAVGFDPGRRFEVSMTRNGPTTSYLLTEVRHHAIAPAIENDSEPASYSNDFIAIPADVPFRPERLTTKPFVRGAQTATVVGPPGENIYCDPFGRVRVQFHWDRRGQRNDQSSCWIRVSQERAGSYYGSQVIPHVGHEVIVSFLEGDPDRPLITGTVPNALTMPPLVLPRSKDKTVQRDHGGNKIIMHGKTGLEHLSLASPRAINMVSAAGSARPLSADVVFQGAVGQASPVTVDDYQDGGALNQLLNTYNMLTSGATSDTDTNKNPAYKEGTDASGGTSSPDYADAGSFNTVAEQNINSLSIGNTNGWIYGNSNSWVNGNANVQINGNSTTVVGGTDYGGSDTNVVAETTIWGTSNTRVYGANVSTTLGDSTTTVLATNQAFNFGMVMAVNLGLVMTLNAGLSITLNPGLSLSQTGLSIAQTNIGISMTENQFSEVGFDFSDKGISIKSVIGISLDVDGLKMFL
jgi:type VI secretion system secreted protein VgrG